MSNAKQLKKSSKRAELFHIVESFSHEDAVFALQTLIACSISDKEVDFLYNYMSCHA